MITHSSYEGACLPHVSKMAAIVYLNPRHCSSGGKHYLPASLVSGVPVCSYQILVCLLEHHLVRACAYLSHITLEFYSKIKLDLWFKFRRGYGFVRI